MVSQRSIQCLSAVLLLAGCSVAANGITSYGDAQVRALAVEAASLETQGRLDEAAAVWLKATQIQRDYAPGYINAADTYQKVGRFKESLTIADQAKHVDTRRVEPYFLSAAAKYAMADYVGASAEWRRLKEVDAPIPEFDRLLGEAAEAGQDFPAALLAYQQAAQAHPTSPTLLFAIARVYAQMGKTEEALRTLRRSFLAGLDPRLASDDLRLANIRSDPRFASLLAAPHTPANAAADNRLFTHLGGFAAIRMIGGAFLQEARRDPRLGATALPPIQLKILAEVCEASGGPCKDIVDSAARESVRVSDSEFKAIVENVKRSLDRLRVRPATRERLLDALAVRGESHARHQAAANAE